MKSRILILDDDRAILDALPLDLEPHFDVACANTIPIMMSKLSGDSEAFDVAVVDMKLGEDREGGLQAIRQISAMDNPPEIVVLTAYGKQENTVKCMEAGAFSYVEKDARLVGGEVTGLLIVTIHKAIANRKLRKQAELARYVPGLVECIATIIDSHEPYTAGHSRRVAHCARMIAKEYGLASAECSEIEMCGYIHDLAKIGIDICALTRASPFTQMEWTMMHGHPRVAAEMVESVPSISHLAPGIRDHHEQYGGGGYPEGKKEEEISIQGRIIAVADSFDAMVSARPYQTSLSLEGAAEAISRCDSPRYRPGQFDPQVVEAFIRIFDRICGEVYQKQIDRP